MIGRETGKGGIMLDKRNKTSHLEVQANWQAVVFFAEL